MLGSQQATDQPLIDVDVGGWNAALHAGFSHSPIAPAHIRCATSCRTQLNRISKELSPRQSRRTRSNHMAFRLRQTRFGKPGGGRRGRAGYAGGCAALAVLATVATTAAAAPASASAG